MGYREGSWSETLQDLIDLAALALFCGAVLGGAIWLLLNGIGR